LEKNKDLGIHIHFLGGLAPNICIFVLYQLKILSLIYFLGPRFKLSFFALLLTEISAALLKTFHGKKDKA